MRKKIICWVGVVAGSYATKGLLIPVLAALISGGPDGVTVISFFLSFMVGSFCVVNGGLAFADAIADGDTRRLGRCAMGIIFGLILLVGRVG